MTTFFKTECCSRDGTLSSIYPPDEGIPIFIEWDDVVPTFLMAGEFNFLLEQTMLYRKQLKYGFPPLHDYLYSWRMDEWLAGLVEMARFHRAPFLLERINDAVNTVAEYFMRASGLVCGILEPASGIAHPVAFSRSGGLIEALLEASEFSPRAGEIALKALDWSAANPYFNRYGLFPSKWFENGHPFNRIMLSPLSFPLRRFPGEVSGQCYMQGESTKRIRLRLSWPYQRVQLMKDNSNLLFACISVHAKIEL